MLLNLGELFNLSPNSFPLVRILLIPISGLGIHVGPVGGLSFSCPVEILVGLGYRGGSRAVVGVPIDGDFGC